MKRFLTRLAHRLIPNFEALPSTDQTRLLGDIFSTMLSIPLFLISLIWLISVTEPSVLAALVTENEAAGVMWVIILFAIPLSRVHFFFITGKRAGSYNYGSAYLLNVLIVSATLIIGPTAIWLTILGTLLSYELYWQFVHSQVSWWNWVRNFSFNLGSYPLSLLGFITIYQALEGPLPLIDLTVNTIWPPAIAVTMLILFRGLFLLFLFGPWYYFDLIPNPFRHRYLTIIFQTMRFAMLSETPSYFGILAAAIYGQMGLLPYSLFLLGLLMTVTLAQQVSQQAAISQQRSRELTELGRLSNALLAAPLNASTLPHLLQKYLPRMFQYYQAEIRHFPDQRLLLLPSATPPLSEALWAWFRENPQPQYFAAGVTLPWTNQPASYNFVIYPIISIETEQPIGGICLLEEVMLINTPADVRPALQTLADQIASTVHSAKTYRQTLAHQRLTQELAVAGQIQASFLPTSLLPDALADIEGWQLTSMLESAMETCGDFFDVMRLPQNKLGLLIADVADKGMGAALFMALSRTLLRTYAFEHPTRPDMVLMAANKRILTDANTKLFVTVFYGVLDLYSGELTYANAGHVPPLLYSPQHPVEKLRNTGMPLGILEGVRWASQTVTINPADTLVLYTDGITEAHNAAQEQFGLARLIEVVAQHHSDPAHAISQQIQAAVETFSGETPQFDDITLLVLKRDNRVAF